MKTRNHLDVRRANVTSDVIKLVEQSVDVDHQLLLLSSLARDPDALVLPAYINACIKKARSLPYGNNRMHALLALAPVAVSDTQKKELVNDAIADSLLIEDNGVRAHALIKLTDQLPDDSRAEEVIIICRCIGEIRHRLGYGTALARLACLLPSTQREQVFRAAFEEIRTIDFFGTAELTNMLQDIPDEMHELRREIFEDAFTKSSLDPQLRSNGLDWIARQFADMWQQQHLEQAFALVQDRYRVEDSELRCGLIPIAERIGWSEVIEPALDAVVRTLRETADPDRKSALRLRLAEVRQQDSAIEEALHDARSVENAYRRCLAILKVAKQCSYNRR